MRTRKRKTYFIVMVVVVFLALSSRYLSAYLPNWFVEYGGDTLWALTLLLFIALIFRKLSSLSVVYLSLIISFGTEISQLYHTPWLDSIRESPIGGLVLGYSFLWSDFVCYAVGIGIGWIIDYWFDLKQTKP